MATASLLGLPAELIVKVIDDSRPQDHINFALSSKRLYQLSDEVLDKHKRWHRSNSRSSDLHPLTVPKLLENILLDPIAAWHIRDLEFWCLRQEWRQWIVEKPGSKNVHSLPEEDQSSGPLVDATNRKESSYIFTHHGFNTLIDHFVEQLGFNRVNANEIIHRSLQGQEEPLKLLIFALAPRLRSIQTSSLYLDVSGRRRQTTGNLLGWLSGLIAKRQPHDKIWPPGFAALRSIAIGVGKPRTRGYIYPFSMIVPLFALPNLGYFYLDHPYSGPSTGEGRYRLPRRLSTVKHVHLTSSDLEINEMSELLAGIAKLQSFSLQSLQRNGCDVLRLLYMHHGESLEYLDMCDTDVMGRLYERYFSELSINSLTIFPNLKYIAIDLLVLLHQHIETRFAHPGQLVTLKPHADIDRIDLSSILPSTIEYIVFKISNANYLLATPVADAVSALVAKTIGSNAFPKLRAVSFEEIGPRKTSSTHSKPFLPTDSPWFEEAVTAGKENGVEVCTVWTHPHQDMRERMDELGIPRAMSARDMKTNHRNA